MERFRLMCWQQPWRCTAVLNKHCLMSLSDGDEDEGNLARGVEAALQTLMNGAKPSKRNIGVSSKRKMKSRPSVLAKEVAWLLMSIKGKTSVDVKGSKASAPPSDSPSACERLVGFFRARHTEVVLLGVIHTRVGTFEEFEKLRVALKDKDERYDGTVPLLGFFDVLDSLGLDLDEGQKIAIACSFVIGVESKDDGKEFQEGNIAESKGMEAATRVDFRTFLAVVDPTLSAQFSSGASASTDSTGVTSSSTGLTKSSDPTPRTPVSAFGSCSGCSSRSQPTTFLASPRAALEAFHTTTGVLGVLENVRERIIVAQSNGVDARECFSHFDVNQDGVISCSEFKDGLQRLGVQFDSVTKFEWVMQVFRLGGSSMPRAHSSTVDYISFLRFLDNDHDSLGFFSREGILSPRRICSSFLTAQPPRIRAVIEESDDEDEILYHDVAKHGPFLAGFSHRGGKRISPRNDCGESESSEEKQPSVGEDGVFVRHSNTSAGYVRQVVVVDTPDTNIKMETHQVVPHGGKGQTGRYTGVLESGQGDPSLSSAERKRMADATKTRAIVKYLGYSAQICNDYPRKEAHVSQVNNVLARNFVALNARKNKKTPKNKKKKRQTKTDSDANTACVESRIDQAETERHIQELFVERFEIDQQLRTTRFLDENNTTALYLELADCQQRLVQCWEGLVVEHLTGARHPSIKFALVELREKGRPVGMLMYEMIGLASARARAGLFHKAKAQLRLVSEILVALNNANSDQKEEKSAHSRPNAISNVRSTTDMPTVLRTEKRDNDRTEDFSLVEIHQIFANAAAKTKTKTKSKQIKTVVEHVAVEVVAQTIIDQAYFDGPSCPLSGFQKAMQAGDGALGDMIEFLRRGTKRQGVVHSQHEANNGDFKVSWEEVVHAFRQEPEFSQVLKVSLESNFTFVELAALRGVFQRAREDAVCTYKSTSCSGALCSYEGTPLEGVGYMTDYSCLIRAVEHDAVVSAFVFDRDYLSVNLSRHQLCSWEEFLRIVKDCCLDVSPSSLRGAIAQAAGETALLQLSSLSSSSLLSNGSKELLCFASQRLSEAFEEQFDAADHNEWHPSLLAIYQLVARARTMEAAAENVRVTQKLNDSVDRFLCSRSGQSTVQALVRNMLGENNSMKSSGGTSKKRTDRDRWQMSRERAELAARNILRAKKRAELAHGDVFSFAKELQAEVDALAGKARDIAESKWGHASLEATQAHFSLAAIAESRGNPGAACESLAVVLHNLYTLGARWATNWGLVAPKSTQDSPAVCVVAERMAKLLRDDGAFVDAAQKFELVARAKESLPGQESASDALRYWREVIACYTKDAARASTRASNKPVADKNSEAVLTATCKVANLVAELEPLSDNLIIALQEYGMLLTEAGDGEAAKDQFLSAKAVFNKQGKLLTPARKKLITTLNRQLASAATTLNLLAIAQANKRSAREEGYDEEDLTWLDH